MEVKILKDEKELLEIESSSQTIVELLRVYLNKDSAVEFVAWKKEHPTKNPILKIVTKGKAVKKALSDAIKSVEKDLDKIEKDFVKLK